MKVLSLALSLSLLSLVACSGKRVVNAEKTAVTENKYLNVAVNWIKDKGNKYDFEVMISNISKTDVIVMLPDMNCARGQIAGKLTHTFFNTGERTIDFRAGQTKQFNMVCNLSVKNKGEYKLTINRVFDNPNGDGATKGPVLAEGIVWSGTL